MDADLRRPRVHDVFDATQEPGLSNALVGDAKTQRGGQSHRRQRPLGAAGRAHAAQPGGAARARAGSRSCSPPFAAQFDWVVIDSPPVMAVTDPNILASLSDSVVFVIGAEMTSYKIARHAVEQLERGRCGLRGRRAEQGADPASRDDHYSHYYRREYANYYAAAERT